VTAILDSRRRRTTANVGERCDGGELDPGFAAAYGMAAYCYVRRKADRWTADRDLDVADAGRLARKAVQLGRDDAVALSRAGHVLAYVVQELDLGTFYIDRALTLNPNLASTWYSSTWLRVWIGELDTAIQHFARFSRMSPLDPHMPEAQSACAFAHLFRDSYDEAILLTELALQQNPTSHPALRASASSNALAGRIKQAQSMVARLHRIDPTFRISDLQHQTPLRRSEHLAKYVEAMRRAGLPE
jgi:adenylate cyclase